MCAQPYSNEMTFTLGANDKGNNEKRPDYRGQLIFEGKSYDLSGWTRHNREKGTTFISGSVQLSKPKAPKDQGSAPKPTPKPASPAQSAPPNPSLDADVPF